MVAVMDGVGQAATSVRAPVVGGDLSRGPSWMVSITVLGWTRRPVTRAGARPGDGLWVTGALGGARAALEAWKRGDQPSPDARAAFAHPLPRVVVGRLLAEAGALAMIDLSDGLGGDAGHLAEQSRVAIELDLDAVPVSLACFDESRRLGVSPQRFAAEGGEDYELLAALPAGFGIDAAHAITRDSGVPLTRVGAVATGSGVRASQDGSVVALRGYDHFR